ncbi:hypothetical protein BSKO_09955 [Bryopsis sp. KO-2023]|nr:hypothetical protein BSKO_09955 [Bryopsis sp. KO-2023]
MKASDQLAGVGGWTASAPTPSVRRVKGLTTRPRRDVFSRSDGKRTSKSSMEATAVDIEDMPSVSSNVSASFWETSTDQLALTLKVKNVVKTYKSKKRQFTAVDNVSLNVSPGKIVALLGPSGSGKTTLLRMIAGLEEVTEGQILFDNEDVTQTPVQDRNLGMVFQSYALFGHMTVAENIAFGLKIRKLDIDHKKRVDDLLRLVELPGLEDRYASQISGGQRQRIALARALACSPRLLLLDEPFGALDALVRRSLRRSMKEIVQGLNLTSIIVTHDQEEAFDLADEVVVFNQGRIEQIGTPEDVRERPASPFVMNFVGEIATVPVKSQLIRKMKFPTDKPMVMFRPRRLQVFEEMQPGEDLAPVTVKDMLHLGFVIRYVLKFDDGVELELPCSREDYNDGVKNYDVDKRLYVRIDHEECMGYHPDEIASATAF